MTHLLTDELCGQITSSTPPLPRDQQGRVLSYDGRILDGMFEWCFEEQKYEMRAAADWQLEQVMTWLQENLLLCDDKLEYCYLEKYPLSGAVINKDKVLEDLKKAMRPKADD